MDTFCVLPWYSKEINKVPTVCCLLPQDYNINQIRQDLIAGIKTPACDKCWKIEESGGQSRRQQENIFLDYKLDLDLDKIKQNCIDNNHSTLLYQIDVGNLCNQACVSCDSGASSRWGELERKMQLTPTDVFDIDLNNIDIDYAHAKRIEFVGGEPFYNKKTFKILEQLMLHNNQDCFISVVTNGSVKLNKKQLDLLAWFNDINICLSIDGIGPVFEYMRWPGKWSTLLKNIKQYQTISPISVSYTISALNVFYYGQTVDWFNSQALKFNHNIVSWPQWLSLEHTPAEIKTHMAQDSVVSAWKNINGNEIQLEEFCKKILQQDQVKNISIVDYMPELWKILNDSANVGK
jgi:hypothetical protein